MYTDQMHALPITCRNVKEAGQRIRPKAAKRSTVTAPLFLTTASDWYEYDSKVAKFLVAVSYER